jgi:hypothetical protein
MLLVAAAAAEVQVLQTKAQLDSRCWSGTCCRIWLITGGGRSPAVVLGIFSPSCNDDMQYADLLVVPSRTACGLQS